MKTTEPKNKLKLCPPLSFFIMQQKYLRIIILMLVGVGISFTINAIYTSYLMHSIDPPISQEQISIAIIGLILSIAWHSPFFIIAYLLYRKYKKTKN